MPRCRVCGGEAIAKRHFVPEMMFGMGEYFEYFLCSECGCLQIAEIPVDLARYYPAEYYSFAVPRPLNPINRYLKKIRVATILGGGNPLGRALFRKFSQNKLLEWARRASARQDSAILDVGCGGGALLMQMYNLGFSNLTGIDPHVNGDRQIAGRIRILRRTLCETEGCFDWIMAHHSLEHMPDPLDALRHINRLLKPEGTALIRVPLADSLAWREYGIHWVQLDAPRHLFLLTRASMSKLAQAARFEVMETLHDSTDFQFWASELYRRNMPLKSTNARSGECFSAEEMTVFKVRAAELNAAGEGDQACFYLKKRFEAQ